ncbi:MAG: ABC transporter ATP-binding protein [Solirubrobacterales bacterium]|nr:ABC transporter ATP-binding protein [Solirubrobacterales bacterium]
MALLDFDLKVSLRSFDLAVSIGIDRETLALVGPSGAGKTTILKAIGGLMVPDSGRIALGGEAWFDSTGGVMLPPENRSVGMVFQEYALFPHMTVRENIAYGEHKGARRTDELIERFRITSLADTRPSGLSGGERQRVALARALVRDPAVLLLDEPLSALDAHTRQVVREELRTLLEELDLPTVLISHDFADASALASRAGVLIEGEVRQLAPVAELARRPADSFVATLTGNNLLPAVSRPDGSGKSTLTFEDGQTIVADRELSGPVGVVIAPWEVEVLRGDLPREAVPANALFGRVSALTPVRDRVEARIGPVQVECRPAEASEMGLEPGAPAWAVLDRNRIELVPLDG